ncbi:MAG: tetratricopeptide repeat protein [Candidatus Margulisiibacteriota bacterium]
MNGIISTIRLLESARKIHCSRIKGAADPLVLTPEIKRHVSSLLPDHRSMPELDRALLLFRSVIPASQAFTFGGRSYFGLAGENGGLEVHCSTDHNNRLRRQTNGFPLPTDIINAPDHDTLRVAKCVEYSFLLVALLRAADLESFLVKEGLDHVFVKAKLGGNWYKLDAFYIDKKIPPRIEPLSVPTEHLSERSTLGLYYSNKSGILKRQGHPEKALPAVKTALKITPDLAEAWVNYGTILLAIDQFNAAADAMVAFEKALIFEPGNSIALNNIAVLLIKQGEREKARKILEDLVAKFPNQKLARNNLLNLNGGPFLAGLFKGLF